MLRLLGEGGLGRPYQYTSDQSHGGSPYRRSYLETFWVPDSLCPFLADFVEGPGFAQALTKWLTLGRGPLHELSFVWVLNGFLPSCL